MGSHQRQVASLFLFLVQGRVGFWHSAEEKLQIARIDRPYRVELVFFSEGLVSWRELYCFHALTCLAWNIHDFVSRPREGRFLAFRRGKTPDCKDRSTI